MLESPDTETDARISELTSQLRARDEQLRQNALDLERKTAQLQARELRIRLLEEALRVMRKR